MNIPPSFTIILLFSIFPPLWFTVPETLISESATTGSLDQLFSNETPKIVPLSTFTAAPSSLSTFALPARSFKAASVIVPSITSLFETEAVELLVMLTVPFVTELIFSPATSFAATLRLIIPSSLFSKITPA